MKVLAVGYGADSVAKQFWPDATIDFTHLKPPKKIVYDALVSFHALNRIAVREALPAIKLWAGCVKEGGEIQIHVPSLEWAAEQILSENPSEVTIFHLFGLQRKPDEFYVSGYTMRDLRTLCEKAGINVIHARAGGYMIGEHECETHLIIGKKATSSSGS